MLETSIKASSASEDLGLPSRGSSSTTGEASNIVSDSVSSAMGVTLLSVRSAEPERHQHGISNLGLLH